MIIGIVAIAKNYAIGRNSTLPWHHAADLKFFKQTTDGNALVMGINTFRAIGRPLPDRLNIVLSSRERIEAGLGVLQLRNSEEVLALSDYLRCDIFIIGGAKTYAAFADVIEKWIVTEVPDTVEDADAFISSDFLEGFVPEDSNDLGNGLTVKTYIRHTGLAAQNFNKADGLMN